MVPAGRGATKSQVHHTVSGYGCFPRPTHAGTRRHAVCTSATPMVAGPPNLRVHPVPLAPQLVLQGSGERWADPDTWWDSRSPDVCRAPARHSSNVCRWSRLSDSQLYVKARLRRGHVPDLSKGGGHFAAGWSAAAGCTGQWADRQTSTNRHGAFLGDRPKAGQLGMPARLRCT